MSFDEYVVTRSPALLRFAAAVLTGDVHLAEDLVQTALVKAHRHWRTVAAADHPDAYVRQGHGDDAHLGRTAQAPRPRAP